MKSNRILLFLLVFLVAFSPSALGKNNDKQEDIVYIVPIKGEINRATKNYVKDVINDLNNQDVEAVIFEIDTYGGLIDEAIDIKDLIISTNIPTISFVNNKAVSAGVLITIASEKVVMAPNATIGSAETIPNTEKILSYWRSVLRDTAQYRNRNPEIIEAMADKDIVIEGLNRKGKLVNLTSSEALENGISDYISSDYSDILKEFGFNNVKIIEKQESLQVKLAKYIASPYLSSILLTIAFVGMVIELLTPGFGLGGTISIIGFGLYFGGNILAGHSHWTSLALFVTGLILLVIEGIVPGFGLPGISGIILVLVGIVLAMDSFGVALLSLSIAVIITTIITIILLKLGFRSTLFNSIVLNTQYDSDKGYLGPISKDAYLNKKGITVSELRPSGFIEINGERLDVLSDGGFIPKDTLVEVVKIEGSKIIVRRV
ncbi:NfeD family protein [Wansuia hejianensis]|uniref:Nodulation protein NfeD n=1 Tax=Wansuia hejianensis TaxID=2763667 RepID=A0A926F2J3_9FIRM|nr:nodulation protein NfeD [Wansuia hejianensis]MBC8590770.1 nodulation protein NfeD [Wansuia hejianensis]